MSGFLQDYLIAERVGHSSNQSCSDSFPRCPTSLFDVFHPFGTNHHVDEISQTKPLNSKTDQKMLKKKSDWTPKSIATTNQQTSVPKKHPFGMENLIY